MDLQTLTYIAVGASFVLYIGIALLTQARSTGEFYVAGGHVHPVVNGMATAADWMSAASFISMAGLIAFLGYDGSVYLMGWTGGYVLLALLLAPYLRKFGKFTVPEFIGDRYESRSARVVAVLCLIVISFTYIAGQMRGVGIVFSRFLNVDITNGLLIGMAIVFFYAVLGGMKGITYTQVAQYCVLIFAYTVPAVFISIQVTDVAIPQLAFRRNRPPTAANSCSTRLDRVVTDLGFAAYTVGTKSRIDIFAITMALMIGTAGLPHVIVRFFTVPRVQRRTHLGRMGAFLHRPALYDGARRRGTRAFEPHGNDSNRARWSRRRKPRRIDDRPELVSRPGKTLAFCASRTRTVTVESSTTTIGISTFKSTESPRTWMERQTNSRSITTSSFSPTPRSPVCPDWVIALIAAGGIAAALSTAAGLLLVISAAISHDLLKGVFARGISDRERTHGGSHQRRSRRRPARRLPRLQPAGICRTGCRIGLRPRGRFTLSRHPVRHLHLSE